MKFNYGGSNFRHYSRFRHDRKSLLYVTTWKENNNLHLGLTSCHFYISTFDYESWGDIVHNLRILIIWDKSSIHPNIETYMWSWNLEVPTTGSHTLEALHTRTKDWDHVIVPAFDSRLKAVPVI